jgi:tetratricopeptide (TPR) repeat protein
MSFKTIISGRLEFGNARTYEQARKMCQQRVENFYKADVFLSQDSIFQEDDFVLDIPRLIIQSTEKTWRNTLDLLEYAAQFAAAGAVNAWMVDEGQVIRHELVEPQSDKAAVQSFLTGRQLLQEEGRENEAMHALNQAIEKFAKHALAYERRGYVNFVLRNYREAIEDFSKSISINPNNPEPYFGRAMVQVRKEDFQVGIADLNLAIQHSIPLQAIHWKARRHKGECHLRLEEYDAAIREFRLFIGRQFSSDNPNFQYCRKAYIDLGKALYGKGACAEALQALENAKHAPGILTERLANECDALLEKIALKTGQPHLVRAMQGA